MSVENQDRGLAARPFELQGTSMEEVHRRSRTVYTREFLLSRAELNDYKKCLTGFDPSLFGSSRNTYTREFLLSCTESDICKQLPEGFDSSVLLELEDDSKGLQEPWKGAGIMLLPNSGNISCRVQFSGLDSGSSSWVSVERSNYLSLSMESNSHGNYHSDSTRHNDLHVSACKSKDTAKRYQVTEKDDYSQLKKSEDPYRPPHTYQGGRTKYERKSHSKKTVKEKMDSGIQEDTQLEGPGIAEGEQPKIKDTTSLAESVFSCPVFKPFSHDYDSQLTRTNSKKANTSIITEYVNEEKSRMTLKEDTINSLEVPSGCSSTVFKKVLPQSLMVNSDSEKGFSGKTCFSTTEDSSSMPKNSSESNIGFHMIQSYESNSKMEFNESLTNRPFSSVQSRSDNGIPRVEASGLYQQHFTLPYDIVSSLLREHNPIRTNHQGITPDGAEAIDSNNMEENECTFDDMWSEIMENIQLEQEMEYNSAPESTQEADFRVQISLPDNQSLISSGNPASSEHLTFLQLNISNSMDHYDAEIHLPDQDSLITIDNLIAPEDRSISIDYPRRVECSKFDPPKSCSEAADYSWIHLPDEGRLITTGDVIASEDKMVSTYYPTRVENSNFVPPKSCSEAAGHAEIHFPGEDVLTIIDYTEPKHLKFMASGLPKSDGTGMSDIKNEVARPGDLMTSDPTKGSATQGQEVPPPLDVTASKVHQDLHFHRSSLHLHNDCNSIHHETTVCYPLNSFQSQTSPQTTFVDPIAVHRYPALQWYSCPNMVLQFPARTASPKLKELCYPHVQNSQSQQPTNFLQHHLPTKNVAFSNLEVGKKQPFSLRHQRTAYPDLAVANSVLLDPFGVKGFDHQMVDSTKPNHESLALHGQRTPY